MTLVLLVREGVGDPRFTYGFTPVLPPFPILLRTLLIVCEETGLDNLTGRLDLKGDCNFGITGVGELCFTNGDFNFGGGLYDADPPFWLDIFGGDLPNGDDAPSRIDFRSGETGLERDVVGSIFLVTFEYIGMTSPSSLDSDSLLLPTTVDEEGGGGAA